MLSMTVTVTLSPSKEKEFLQIMESLQESMNEVTGLKKLTVCQKVEDSASFDVIYEWEKPEALKGYLQMEHYNIFRGALRVLGDEPETR